MQLAGLLYMTGGLTNPFSLLMAVPVVVSATSLPLAMTALLGGMVIAMATLLAFFHLPLPWYDGAELAMPFIYVAGAWVALSSSIAFTGIYAFRVAEEARLLANALSATELVLQREQHLSALDGLAAAAAHELGTPLATISIVAKEMVREAPTPQVKEDAELLMAQSERCREILRRLTDRPDAASDEVHERLSLRQLVQEVIEAHADTPEVRVEAIVTGAAGAAAPDIRRMPEITHAFTSFVENAVDFAASEVLITARFDAETVSMEVRDDGPGFAPEILAKLGEPYVTTRPGAEGSRTGHIGMGLGFFISKTLLERTGAVVTFQNGRPRGAIVTARWPRAKIEVGSS
jgi:two-component system sensor histidine kinase RegB